MGWFGIQGPKELLASAIASALDEFFIVDPKKIKSNLLNDAKITLQNVQLRPQKSIIEYSKDTVIVSDLSGKVDLVTFSWHWSISSSNESLVKDATLEISGIKFKVKLHYDRADRQKQPEKAEKKEETELKKITKEGAVEKYIREQVEHIINALTLCVTDFEFTLELPSCNLHDGEFSEPKDLEAFPSGIVAGGKRIELRSLGNKSNTKTKQARKSGEKLLLKQRLLIENIYIDVLSPPSSQNVQTRFPLLGNFSYQATADQSNEKRFGSLSTGIKFLGSPMDAEEKPSTDMEKSVDTTTVAQEKGANNKNTNLTLYAGLEQISVLSSLVDIFLQRQPSSTSSTTNNEVETPKEPPIKKEIMKNDQYEELKDEVLSSSIFVFSVSGISLVLHNGTQITLQEFNCHYHADGSVMRIEGNVGSGILVDNYPLVATKSDHDEASRWIIDIISSTFSIEQMDDSKVTTTETIANIQIRPDLFQKIYSGVIDAVELSLQKTHFDTISLSDSNEEKAEPSAWSIEIQQPVAIHLNDFASKSEKQLSSISIYFDSLYCCFDSLMLKCDGIRVVSNPTECILITVPSITPTTEGTGSLIDGRISIQLDSSDRILEIIDYFGNLVTNQVETKDITDEEKQNESVPINLIPINIPCATLNILESQYNVEVKDISVKGQFVEAQTILFEDDIGTSIKTSGIVISYNKDVVVRIDKIDDITIPGLVTFNKPINRSEIIFDGRVLILKLKDAEGELMIKEEKKSESSQSEGSKTSESESSQSEGLNSFFPLPINLIVDCLRLKAKSDAKEGEKEVMNVSHLMIEVEPYTKVESSIHLYDLIKIQFDEFTSKLVTVPKTEFSSCVNMEAMELRDLTLSKSTSDPIRVRLGSSLIFTQIANVFKDKHDEETIVYKMPFSNVGKLTLDVSYDMTHILSAENIKFSIDTFTGSSSTTSDDLLKYYAERVSKHVPGFLHETNLLGANIVDTTVACGSIALSTVPFAGVIGVLGYDVVKKTLEAGRESRDPGSDGNYQAGDFVRGLVYSAKQSTAAGAKMRLKENNHPEEEGNPLDFVIGSSLGAVDYVDKNKRKLGSAGGAGVGMCIGTAMGGPIGTIAGGFIGAVVASGTIGIGEDIARSTIGKKSVVAEEVPQEMIESSGEVGSLGSGPKGLLYRRGNILLWEWEPFWFTIDCNERVLKRHQIMQNGPPKIDTNVFRGLNPLALKKGRKGEDKVMQINHEVVESIELSKCDVSLNEKLSSDKFKLFAFTISDKKKFMKEEWHLSSDSEESRLMWMTIIAEMTGDLEVLKNMMQSL